MELGAGKGVVGIAAAILGAAQVVVTDHAGAMAALNRSVVSNPNAGLNAAPLDWTNHSTVLS